MAAAAALAALFCLQLPSLAAGARTVDGLQGQLLGPQALTREEMEARCPLFLDATQPTARSCCKNSLLYSCQSRLDGGDFEKGTEVQLMSPLADVPLGAYGTVAKFQLPKLTVSFPQGQRAVHAYDLESTAPWSCQCSDLACRNFQKHIHILSYEVRGVTFKGSKGLNKYVTRAEFDPKVYDADNNEVAIHDPDDTQKFLPGPRYVLFLYPEADHNGAFAFFETLCVRLSCWRRRGYHVVMRSVDSATAATEVLKLFPKRSLHHAIVGGHGFARGLYFGEGLNGLVVAGGSDSGEMVDTLRERLLLNASVTLDSCSTAENTWLGKNFFEWVAAKLPGRRVVGSTVSLSDNMWKKVSGAKCLAGDTVNFEEGGKDMTALASGGLPDCEELTKFDVEEFGRAGGECLSDCGGSCKKSAEAWSRDERGEAQAKLERVFGAKDDRDSCPFYKSDKHVCKILF